MSSNAADFSAHKRRRDAARRLPPLDCGRRDPDGRPAFDPAPMPHVLDHQDGDVHHLDMLRALHSHPGLTEDHRAAIARAGLVLRYIADTGAGEVAA